MYKNQPVYNKGSIVFIPDYVSKQLTKIGITIDTLYTVSTILDSSDRYATINQLAKKMKDNISDRDIRDIAILNDAMYRALFKISVRSLPASALWVMIELCDAATGEYIIDANNTNELVNLYVNNKIDIKTILVNGNNKNELYTCDVITDTLIVVVHDGFTNFMVMNDQEVTTNLSEGLLDYYAQRLGEESYERSFLATL